MERKQSENESFDFRVDVLLAIIQQMDKKERERDNT